MWIGQMMMDRGGMQGGRTEEDRRRRREVGAQETRAEHIVHSRRSAELSVVDVCKGLWANTYTALG